MPQFQKGNQAAKGHGRPPKSREAALLAIAHEIVNATEWRKLVMTRLMDALGEHAVEEKDPQGNKVWARRRDPTSNAKGRNDAATWIRDTLIGKPNIYIGGVEDSPQIDLARYSEAEIEQLIATLDDVQILAGEIDANEILRQAERIVNERRSIKPSSGDSSDLDGGTEPTPQATSD